MDKLPYLFSYSSTFISWRFLLNRLIFHNCYQLYQIHFFLLFSLICSHNMAQTILFALRLALSTAYMCSLILFLYFLQLYATLGDDFL